jgi:hypothetical protein
MIDYVVSHNRDRHPVHRHLYNSIRVDLPCTRIASQATPRTIPLHTDNHYTVQFYYTTQLQSTSSVQVKVCRRLQVLYLTIRNSPHTMQRQR